MCVCLYICSEVQLNTVTAPQCGELFERVTECWWVCDSFFDVTELSSTRFGTWAAAASFCYSMRVNCVHANVRAVQMLAVNQIWMD